MRFVLLIAACLALPACRKDETVSGYAGVGSVWVLRDLGGAAYAARATIAFPRQGRIEGEAPCNRWFAAQNAPYPWFEAGPVGSTRMACAGAGAEAAFFAALARVTLAEVAGDVLILRDEAGFEMVFERVE